MYIYFIFINVSVKGPFHAMIFRVKVDNDFDGFGVTYEETVRNEREKGRLNGSKAGLWVSVVAWIKFLLDWLGFDYVYFVSPFYKLTEGGLV